MDWIKDNWEKLAVFVVTLIVVLASVGTIKKALGYPDQFVEEAPVPKSELPPLDFEELSEAQMLLDDDSTWRDETRPIPGTDNVRKLPLFVSIPMIEVEGRLIDLSDPNAEKVREPVTNQWLMENNLDLLSSSILDQDSDGDAFTNLEEWEAKTSPVDPADHPVYATKMKFISRQQQSYIIKFAARPDEGTFQISRVPTSAWPKRATFLMGIGDTSEDGQFRIESIEEKTGTSNVGITVDAAELTVTHLPTDTKHIVKRGVDTNIPTYFAEFQFPLGDGKSFYKKIGESFALELNPETKYKVIDIQEDRAVVSPGAGKPDVTVTK